MGPERRRPQVLDAALVIARERGVASVTIGAVAEQLKVTRPVVYACFADRVELLRALLDRENDVLLGETIAALPHDRADADEAVFVAGFQTLLQTVARRAKPADAHLQLRARQHDRVFAEGKPPSDEGLIESQTYLGNLA